MYLNSSTVPSSSVGVPKSKAENEWCAIAASPGMINAPPIRDTDRHRDSNFCTDVPLRPEEVSSSLAKAARPRIKTACRIIYLHIHSQVGNLMSWNLHRVVGKFPRERRGCSHYN